jgi:predicted nicotinamide N-methyase
MDTASRRAFILANTALSSPAHVPEIRLRLADDAHSLWQRTEDELAEIGLPPPFWAFAWAGGQGLARYVIDHPETVRGRKVLDFACGSGLVAIAAMRAGAASVKAVDIDRFAALATQINAQINDVSITTRTVDLIGTELDMSVLLAGDVFYDAALAERIVPWFQTLSHSGVTVLVGDPGRAYLPNTGSEPGLELLADYQVPVTRALEDADIKRTKVYRFG